jgi:hypothetical protein
MKHQSFALVVVGAILFAPACRSQEYPEMRFSRVFGVEGNWNRAEDVLFGRVVNVLQVGTQQIANPPQPLPDTVHEIYWCQADFRAAAAVKGSLPAPGKKVLWAVIRPDCSAYLDWDLDTGANQPPVTRVWFLREEGEYLRPVSDGGLFSVSFNWKWVDVPKAEAPRLFASLLLDPASRGFPPERYSEAILDASEVARSILPKEELVARLKTLSLSPVPRAREDICGYLAAAFQEPCK